MLDALIQSQGPRLFSLCCRLCRSRGEAEDLYQETLLRGLEQREQLLAAENPGAYLTRICVNLYRDWARRRKLLSFISMEDAPPPNLHGQFSTAGPEESLEQSLVRQAVDTLPEPYRQTVLLYYFCDQSIQQAAAALGVRPGTVKSRLGRGREMLKEVLKDG
jgi:RNA polymerase sigma-70 factor (ECF subfamily)